jgi:hypothetical protein
MRGSFVKDGFTRLVLILDRSRSMAAIKDATVVGVNRFIEDQKRVPGTATLKLVQFDDVCEEVFDRPISAAPELTLSKEPKAGQVKYSRRGRRALLDAIGCTLLVILKELIEEMDYEKKPTKVIIVIMTGGLENASTKFSKERLLDGIASLRRSIFDFVYLGAYQDAIAIAATMGIDATSAMDYKANWMATVNAVSATSAAVRRSRTTGQNVKYTSHDRAAAVVEDPGPLFRSPS